jgi:quinol monooxygenase YgiN
MSTTIFATIEAQTNVIGEVEQALKKMIVPTRAEAGCISYVLFRSADKTGIFHLLETYVDEQALVTHHQSAHFAELLLSLAERLVRDITIEYIVALEA